MEPVTTILLLLGSILSIILFFKVWGMTSDVKALKKHLVDNDSIRLNIRMALAKKSKNMEDLLFSSMFKELYQLYLNRDSSTSSNYMKVIEDYKRYYERAEVNFPEEFNTMDSNRFMKFL